MKIGEIAESLGVSPRTIRFYEEEGLLSSQRTPGGTRRYDAQDIQRLKSILHLTELGFSLAQVKAVAMERSRHASGAKASIAVSALLDDLLVDLKRRIDLHKRLVQDIERAQALISGCRRCKKIPDRKHCPQCPLNQHPGKSEIANLIWDQGHGAGKGPR